MAGEESRRTWEEQEDDEWELCNDDGFVYKRRKRKKTDDDLTATTSGGGDGSIVDLEAEIRQKKKTQRISSLVKLKDRYKREIVQWENLSNTLRNMEEKTLIHHQQQDQPQLRSSSSSSVMKQQERTPESSCGSLIDNLILQAEAQEAMIQDISSLCDAAEAICREEEDSLKQSFFDLPIWESSPRSLLASLCDQDDSSNNVQMT